jgi:hypothetical protein
LGEAREEVFYCPSGGFGAIGCDVGLAWEIRPRVILLLDIFLESFVYARPKFWFTRIVRLEA